MDSSLSASPYLPIRGAYVRDKVDALILCQAAQDGVVQQASQRISIQQRKQLATSGSLFVFEKSAAEMERWTDGRGWSRSRQLPDKFFVYFEEYANGSNNTSAGLSNEDMMTPKRTKRNDPSDLIGALVGPLRHLPGFSLQVLIKKTITLKFPGKEWHVVSYFTVQDVLTGKLPAVSEDARFRGPAMRVPDSSQLVGQGVSSPPANAPILAPMRQGRMRSCTWSNGSGAPMDISAQEVHARHASCPSHALQARVVAPPRLDSLPRYQTFHGAIPVNGGLNSDPASPTRRTGSVLTPLDTTLSMSPNRRASAPTGFSAPAHSGTSSPTSANFTYSPMPFHVPSLNATGFNNASHQMRSSGQPPFSTASDMMSLGSPSVSQGHVFPPPHSAGGVHTLAWGYTEGQQPISPSTYFDLEGYYNSTLTPDQGSQHSSPTIPEFPNTAEGQAAMTSSMIDPLLEVGNWGFDFENGRNCTHSQLTPKAFEHGSDSFAEGLLIGSHDSDPSLGFHHMQWMESDSHNWATHV